MCFAWIDGDRDLPGCIDPHHLERVYPGGCFVRNLHIQCEGLQSLKQQR